jgi:hypothetical protein
MTKLRFVLLALVCLCGSLLGQTAQPAAPPKGKAAKPARDAWTVDHPEAFCEKGAYPEIVAFCKDLAELQTHVNAETKNAPANLAITNPQFTNALGKLDLTNPKSLGKFITATGPSFAMKTALIDVLRDVGQKRPDQQLGASGQASGTTSLVAKAGSAELLSLAMDAGILTRSVNGATTTLSTNADQVFRLITGSDPDCTVTCRNRGWFEAKVLNPTNISATLDVAQRSDTTAATTGQASGATPVQVNSAVIPSGAGKLSSLKVRYQLLNRFDPRGDKFKQAWKTQVTSLSDKVILLADDIDAVKEVLQTHKPFSNTENEELRAALISAASTDPSGQKLVRAFHLFWLQLMTQEVMQDPKLAPAVLKAVQDRAVYRAAWLNAVHQAVGNLLTFEYSFNRPSNQPETNDLKLIYGYNFNDVGLLTFNGAASIYSGALPTGAKYGRLHYGQVSAQYDRTLAGKNSPVQGQLSLAGYWQYQPEASVLNIPAGTVAPGTNIPLPNGTQEFVGTAGSLWVTQAKITLKGSGGINVPLGVSWSNKTDLLIGHKVGAQIGISYNFASLSSLFSGSSAGQ